MNVLSVFYGDPDLYPPIINGTHLLSKVFSSVDVMARDNGANVLPRGGVQYPENATLIRFRSPPTSTPLQYADFVFRVIRRAHTKPNLVIAHDAHALLPALLVACRLSSPLVYHCHDYVDNTEAVSGSQRVFKLLERWIAPRTSAIIVPDAERAEVIVRQLKLRRRPIIAANAPLSTPKASSRLRDTLKAQAKQFSKIVFRPGRIGPNHALEATLRSLPLWGDPSWGFVIMGPADSAYRDYLLGLAEELGVAHQFTTLPPVAYPEVAQFISGADLGHGLYEPTNFNHVHFATASNKIMEYLAAGLPVLLSESSGSRALLSRYNLGLISDVISPRSIADAINRILGDDELVSSMRAESRRAFAEEFNYEKQYGPAIQAFKEVVKQQSPRRRQTNRSKATR